MSKKRNYKKKGVKPYFPKADELSTDSDANFSFIAGYTSGGVPYGLTWEEYNPNHDDNTHEHPKRKIK
jgi:hypothetical protein